MSLHWIRGRLSGIGHAGPGHERPEPQTLLSRPSGHGPRPRPGQLPAEAEGLADQRIDGGEELLR